WGQPAPLLVFTAWQLVAGGLILLPMAFAIEGMPPALSMRNVVGFAYLGIIGTGLAYALWFRGVERLKASTVTFLILLSPVSAITVDFLVLHRTLSISQIGGALVVLMSIFVAQTSDRRRRDSACES
ncbi:MAG TPA: EamA family transporter, partial [Nitrososphaera sp.]|nr:EamA family transporter [Nitrososphaera sp.]